jgi:hypothetical protein
MKTTLFYDTLIDFFRYASLEQNHIFNVDETRYSSVQEPASVISREGQKQAGNSTGFV